MATKYLTKKNIVDNELSEIDFDFYKEFEIDTDLEDEDEGFNEYEYVINQYGSSDGFPIKIERVIEHLKKIKKAGCNYVEIEYHCDHIGYLFSGFKIEEATEEQISTYKNKQEDTEKKNKEIAVLESEIVRLKNR